MIVPRVTIGLPVYNGEKFIAEAISSILGQTFGDFELIVSDNVSTDQTGAICRDFARKEERIRYVRNEVNIGAAPNFNGIVAKAQGEFFKWMAHDDVIMPDFLAQCVTALDDNLEAVLACPRVRFINEVGDLLDNYISPFRTDDPDPVVRFGETLYGHRCFEVFGLIRLHQLKKTKLIYGYNHGDGVLLSHLALMGKFIAIPEELFLSRCHQNQSMYVFGITNAGGKYDHEAYARWFDPRHINKVPRSYSKGLVDYATMVSTTPLPALQRLACYQLLSRWLLAHWRVIAGEWKRTIYQLLGLDSRTRDLRA